MTPPTNYPVGIAGAVIFIALGFVLTFRAHAVQRWAIRQLDLSARTERARRLVPLRFVESGGYILMLRVIGASSLAVGLFLIFVLIAGSG